MKKFSIYWLFCFVTLQSFAQTDASLSVTDTPPNWPFMLSSLNSSQITSGILYDKSNGFTNLYNYNLDGNNLSGKKHFFDALNELHRASDMTKLISVDELQNRIATTTSNITLYSKQTQKRKI